MDMENIVRSIEIQDSAGNTKALIDEEGAKIELRAGGTMEVSPNDDGEIVLSAGVAVGDDPYYVQKYKDLIKGQVPEGPNPTNPDYHFSGWNNNAKYKYIATIVGSPGTADNVFFLLGAACSQVGLFTDITIEEGIHPGGESGYPASDYNNLDITTHGLHIFDMCGPDVDCADYKTFYEYMSIVAQQISEQKHNIESPPSPRISDPPDDYQGALYGFGSFDQYIALLAYWNYMVLLLIVRSFVTKVDDNTYRLTFTYRNVEGNIGAGARLDVTYSSGLGATITSADPVCSFLPVEHSSLYSSGGGASAYAELTDIFKLNTRWTTVVTIDVTDVDTGDTVEYEGAFTNTPFETSVTGQFVVERA